MQTTDAKSAYVRLAIVFIALANLLLTVSFNAKPFPLTSDHAYQILSLVLVLVTITWVWFKDNPVTAYGKAKNEAGINAVGTPKEYSTRNTKER